jgi:hypothetical protein
MAAEDNAAIVRGWAQAAFNQQISRPRRSS